MAEEIINLYTDDGSKIISLLGNALTAWVSRTPAGGGVKLAINIFVSADSAIYSTNVEISKGADDVAKVKFTENSVAMASILLGGGCAALADLFVAGLSVVGVVVEAPGVLAIVVTAGIVTGLGIAVKYLAGIAYDIYQDIKVKFNDTKYEFSSTDNKGVLTCNYEDIFPLSTAVNDLIASNITISTATTPTSTYNVGLDGSLIKIGESGDTVYGGAGEQTIVTGSGNDLVYGDLPISANATIDSSKKYNDYIDAKAGNDTIYGGQGSDIIHGGEGNDLICGASNDGTAEAISGGVGNYLYGEEGNDIIWAGGTESDYLDGGVGNDTLHATGDVSATLFGNTGDDSLIGANGNDIINGGEGRNTLIGGSGVDTYIANSNDVIIDTDGYGSVSLKTAKPVLQALRSNLISVQSWEKNQKIAA